MYVCMRVSVHVWDRDGGCRVEGKRGMPGKKHSRQSCMHTWNKSKLINTFFSAPSNTGSVCVCVCAFVCSSIQLLKAIYI